METPTDQIQVAATELEVARLETQTEVVRAECEALVAEAEARTATAEVIAETAGEEDAPEIEIDETWLQNEFASLKEMYQQQNQFLQEQMTNLQTALQNLSQQMSLQAMSELVLTAILKPSNPPNTTEPPIPATPPVEPQANESAAGLPEVRTEAPRKKARRI